ncbi:hypothetical protein [Azospirillum sp. SYSU D00513]|uniref:hypothetical protein n=1 Tax=Azospirillum sp. SYSU D00513 TaxID=2812561 RepID=UPI001A96CD8B|nr:hypothetical protein [Azospirillum sp. SYSU D00513]
MHRQHLSATFRDSFSVGTSVIEIHASHTNRQRPAKPHEVMRQLARGQAPLGLTREESYSWRVIAGGRCVGSIHQNPNGSFSSGRHNAHRPGAPVEAMRIVACRMLGFNPAAAKVHRP